jgi:hypothetical protein
LTPILFLLLQAPLYSPSMLFFISTLLSFLLFSIGTSPFHIFAGVGGASFPNSTCLFQTKFESEFFFFFSNVWFLDDFVPCFDCLCFFWIRLINNFCLLCGEII